MPSIKYGETQTNYSSVIDTPTRDEFYTNYPFFKYWKVSNDEALLLKAPLNVYIHIPYCIQICDYCFYQKELVKSKEQVDEYLGYLCKEIELVTKRLELSTRPVQTVYIGGGTPSVLTEQQFRKLTECLHKNHNLAHLSEFTFEAEPGTFSRSKLSWYKECGVNRVSMGVQSFNDEVIKLSSRKHTSSQAVNSIRMVKEMDVFKTNIDLLSGLAGEQMSTWEQSVETAIKENVDLITIYKMKTYANTNFFKKGVKSNEISLPTAEEEANFMKRAIDILMETNYKRWTTFAFAKDDHKHLYAENTWRGQDLVAYGVSSFGKIGNTNYQNLNTSNLYYAKINADRLPLYRTYKTTVKDTMVKELLLCSSRLSSYSKKEFMEKFGYDYFNLIPEVLDELTSKGFITGDRNDLVLTDFGILYGDFVGKVIASSVKKALSDDNIGFNY